MYQITVVLIGPSSRKTHPQTRKFPPYFSYLKVSWCVGISVVHKDQECAQYYKCQISHRELPKEYINKLSSL